MRHLAVSLLTLAVLSPVAAQEARVLKLHEGWVGGAAFSADSGLLATAGADRVVRIVDFKDPARKRVVAGHRDIICAVAFAPRGELLATGGYDHLARIVDLANGKALSLEGHQGAVMALAFAPDGKLLATGSIDARVILWDVVTGKAAHTLTNHRSWVNAVVFNKDGLLATGSSDNTVRLWRGPKWSEVAQFEFPEGEVRSLAFSPDGKTLVAGVRYGTIKIIDVSERTLTTRKAHAADVWTVAFSPDGKTLASGDGDWDRPGDVRLWDTTSWKEKQLLKTTGEVLSLAYSPDGRYLAAGCWDGTVHLWPVKLSPLR